MAAVPFDPDPFDVVPRSGLDQVMPKVGVANRLLRGIFPAVTLPTVDPLGDAFEDIFAVSVQFDLTWLDQNTQRLNRCPQFHPVICGVWVAA